MIKKMVSFNPKGVRSIEVDGDLQPDVTVLIREGLSLEIKMLFLLNPWLSLSFSCLTLVFLTTFLLQYLLSLMRDNY